MSYKSFYSVFSGPEELLKFQNCRMWKVFQEGGEGWDLVFVIRNGLPVDSDYRRGGNTEVLWLYVLFLICPVIHSQKSASVEAV